MDTTPTVDPSAETDSTASHRRFIGYVGVLLHLFAGTIVFVSELVVPMPVRNSLLALWLVLGGVLLLVRKSQPWAAVTIGPLTIVLLITVATLGDILAGWTA